VQATDPPGSDPTADLNEALGKLARVLRLFATDDADVLSSTQMVALGALLQRGGVRLTELADALGCDLSVASRQLNLLVERGYAARTRDPEDGRAWQFWLTDDGSALLERIRTRRLTWLAEALASFDPAQRRAAADVLGALVDALKAVRGKKPPHPGDPAPATPTITAEPTEDIA